MLGWHLFQLRNEDLFIGDCNTNWKMLIQKQLENNNLQSKTTPFQNLKNPFSKTNPFK